MLEVKRLSSEIDQVKQSLRQQTRSKKKLEGELALMNKKYSELEQTKKKELER